MEAAAASRTAGRNARAREDQEDATATGAKTPWWMWIAVARDRRLLPVPVLLADQHLAEDRQRPAVVEPVPAPPDARQLQGDLQEPRLHARRCATARSSRCSTTVLALVVGSFCAYALARLKLRGQVRDPRDRAVDLDVPADRDRGAAVQAVVGHRALQHLDRADHPVPDVRAAADDLHPRVVLPGDPEGPRGGGAGRRRDALPGVPQGRRAARGARPGDRRDPDVHRRVERVPARRHADVVVDGAHGAGGDRVLHRARPSTRCPTAASRPRRSSSRCR